MTMQNKYELFEKLKLSKEKIKQLKGGSDDLPTGGVLATIIDGGD